MTRYYQKLLKNCKGIPGLRMPYFKREYLEKDYRCNCALLEIETD